MDPVKRKVITELFFAPSVVLPIVAGISAGLLSWAGGSINSLNAAAIVGILGGLGWMATRVIFKVEEITEQALRLQISQQQRATEAELDQLAEQLIGDGDPRTQDYLTLLRSLRDDFDSASRLPGVQGRSAQLRERIGEVFQACVDHLRETLRLRGLTQKLAGPSRLKIEAEREQLLQEISIAIDHLRQTVSEFQSLVKQDRRVDLNSLREELDTTLRIAKMTEQRLRELDSTSDRVRENREPT